MPPPIGFRWADKEWHLDESGPWMDSVLGIGEWILGIHKVVYIRKRNHGKLIPSVFAFFLFYLSPPPARLCTTLYPAVVSTNTTSNTRNILHNIYILSRSEWLIQMKMVGYTQITSGRMNERNRMHKNLYQAHCPSIVKRRIVLGTLLVVGDGIVKLKKFIKRINIEYRYVQRFHENVCDVRWAYYIGNKDQTGRLTPAIGLYARFGGSGDEYTMNGEGRGYMYKYVQTQLPQARQMFC
jgi:hypothetical protein